MEVFLNVCRCCLNPKTEVSIFDQSLNLKVKFQETTSVEVNLEDGLPQKLCHTCFELLNSAYHFRSQCIKMDSELKAQLLAAITQAPKTNSIDQMEEDAHSIFSQSEEMITDDFIGNDSMKQLQSMIKSEPLDSDDEFYVVLIPNENDEIEIKREIPIEHDFKDSIENFLMSDHKVTDNVPATILANEEIDESNDIHNDDLETELIAAAESQVHIDNDDEHVETITANLDDIQDRNLIKILTTTDSEGNLILRSSDQVTYYPSGSLSHDGEDGLSQEEVLVYEEGENSQFQIVSCDGDLVIEYADENQLGKDEQSQLSCCGVQFDDVQEFEDHQGMHEEEETVRDLHLCKLCGKGFESEEILTGHMVLHKVRGHFINCPFCNLLVKRTGLTQHIKYGHSNFRTRCKMCGKSFANPNNLKRHMMIHSGVRQFQCDICNKRFHQKITMQTHRLTHIDPFSCIHCDQSFDNKTELDKHHESGTCARNKLTKVREELVKTVRQEIRNIEGELLGYACSLCKKMFSVESALEMHVENSHLKNSSYYCCTECGEVHLSEKDLATHIMTHKNAKNKNMKRFDCSMCGKGCPSRAMLMMHERVHTDERPYPCTLCPAKFKTKTHLRTHQLTHTREKKFGCSVCMRFFALKGNLVVHLRTHTGERPYVCNVCGDAFIDSKYLKKHKKRKHAIVDIVNKYDVTSI